MPRRVSTHRISYPPPRPMMLWRSRMLYEAGGVKHGSRTAARNSAG